MLGIPKTWNGIMSAKKKTGVQDECLHSMLHAENEGKPVLPFSTAETSSRGNLSTEQATA